MIPGMLFALSVFNTPLNSTILFKIFIGIISICLIASANYVINEWLDAEFDKHHPVKKLRPSVVKSLNPRIVYFEYAAFAIAGLSIALYLSSYFFLVSLLLLIMVFLLWGF